MGWIVYTRIALQAMLPYLTVKAKQAELILSLDFSKGRKLTEKDWVDRDYVEAILRDEHKNFIWKEGD